MRVATLNRTCTNNPRKAINEFKNSIPDNSFLYPIIARNNRYVNIDLIKDKKEFYIIAIEKRKKSEYLVFLNHYKR